MPGYDTQRGEPYRGRAIHPDCARKITAPSTDEKPIIQFAGNVPEEVVEPIQRIYRTCLDHDFDASGEFVGHGIHVKWSYLKATRVMCLQYPKKNEIQVLKPQLNQHTMDLLSYLEGAQRVTDPQDRHIHIVDPRQHPADICRITLCSRAIILTWGETIAPPTCPRCIQAAEEIRTAKDRSGV